jgi:hypothetical protein
MPNNKMLGAVSAIAILAAGAAIADTPHSLMEHADEASEHALLLAEAADAAMDPMSHVIDAAIVMIEDAHEMAEAGDTAGAKDEMVDAVLALKAAHELSEAVATSAASAHAYAEEAHMLTEQAVAANAEALAADAEDVHLLAVAEELVHADKEAGHSDAEAETAQNATEAAHVAVEAALAAAEAVAGLDGDAAHTAIEAALAATEAADDAAWAAEHTLHDLLGSSEHAHDVIMAAHNIAETVELIEMLEHSK